MKNNFQMPTLRKRQALWNLPLPSSILCLNLRKIHVSNFVQFVRVSMVVVLLFSSSIHQKILNNGVVWMADAFAVEMVERSALCWAELNPSEVIMNFNIIPESQSRNKNVKIKILDPQGSLIEPTREEEGYNVYYHNANNFNEEDMYTAKISVPPNELPDLQYVMDLTEGGEFSDENFNVGCEKRRAYGRARNDRGNRFHIKNIEEGFVEIKAGWATEHEAVTLTKAIRFYFTDENNQSHDAAKKETFDTDKNEQTLTNGGGKDNIIMDEQHIKYAMERMEHMKRSIPHAHLTQEEIVQNQIGHDHNIKKAFTIKTTSKQKELNEEKSIGKKTLSAIHRYREQHDRVEFGQGSFSDSQFVYALIFVILSFITLIHGASNQSKYSRKGRRNL